MPAPTPRARWWTTILCSRACSPPGRVRSTDPAADINRNGLISTTGLATYLNRRVPTLTDGKQTSGMEVRFDTTVFAVGQ